MRTEPALICAPPSGDWRVNNFDLIRLFAATQVALVHADSFFKPAGLGAAILDAGLRLFPGVPIFFLVSGLLISRSFERTGSLRDYFRNRCLRIFPALWICLVASIAVIVMMLNDVGAVTTRDWLLWWGAQMSLFQGYTADFMHGVRYNGSLWTIPIELEFYLALPALYVIFRLRERRGDVALGALALGSLALHQAFFHLLSGPHLVKYFVVLDTVVPYLWMFLAGVLIQRNWHTLRTWFAGRALWWILGYVLLCAVFRELLHVGVGSSEISPLFLLPLAGVVMSCAISAPTLADRILAHNDISYGTYIYHMLVVLVMLQLGIRGTLTATFSAVAVSLGLGALSWFCLERRFLRRKRQPLRTVPEAPPRVVEPGGLGRLLK